MPPEQTHPAAVGGVPVHGVDFDDAPAGMVELLELEDDGSDGDVLELDTAVVAAGAEAVVAVGGMTHKPPSHTKLSLG